MELFLKSGQSIAQGFKSLFLVVLQCLSMLVGPGKHEIQAQNPSYTHVGMQGELNVYRVSYTATNIDEIDFTLEMAEGFDASTAVEVDWAPGWFDNGSAVSDAVTTDGSTLTVRVEGIRVLGTGASGSGSVFVIAVDGDVIGIVDNVDN